MRKLPEIAAFVEGILAGEIAMLSRAITLVESKSPKHQDYATQILEAVLPYTGKAKRIGITGVPGVGKSTFIEAFGMELIGQGHKLAVLAIDPTSAITKGSILGDKTRMEQLSVHPNAYIRPTAASGSLGGVSYKTKEAMLLCEAAGFDTIIVETVGVGQSEIEVAQITDFFLLLMLAGAGDELQGIKRGIMEMADGMVITKADGENVIKAKNARTEYARALHFFPPKESQWTPLVLLSSSYEKQGMPEVWEMINSFYNTTTNNGWIETLRQKQNIQAFDRILKASFHQLLLHNPKVSAEVVLMQNAIQNDTITPYGAVNKVMKILLDNVS